MGLVITLAEGTGAISPLTAPRAAYPVNTTARGLARLSQGRRGEAITVPSFCAPAEVSESQITVASITPRSSMPFAV
jgi:hypothetical protein